jgi:methyl-accepting chemotaxis protein
MFTRSLSIKVALLSGAALAVVFAIGMVILVQRVAQTIETQTQQLQTSTTQAVADEVASGVIGAARAADGIVTTLEALHAAGGVSRDAYNGVLRHFLERNPQLLGAWSGWEPNALDGKDADFVSQPGYDATGRFVPYWNRGSGSIAVEPLLDYDKPGPGDYYQLPKANDRAVAIEPYSYAVGGKDILIMSFGVPIKDGGTYLGTGGVDLSLADLNTRLAELKPFGTGHVELITSSGIVVASGDPEELGKPLDANDPTMALVKATLADGKGQANGTDDGVDMQAIAQTINVGGTEDRWVVISYVPVSTLQAAVNEAVWTIVILAALCVLVACGILFGLIRQMVGRPLGAMGATVETMAGGNYEVTVPGTARVDEMGTLARAVEVFRENGIKVGQMTEEEKLASVRRRQERGDMMVALQAAFGEVVDAAIAGDFTKRVHAQFPDPELNSLANSVNQLVETVDGGLGEVGGVLAALADTDLTKRMHGQYSGSFAKLKEDTNAVGDKLTDVVTQLRDTSRALKTATSEILSGANDLSERTTKQAATIEETSAAMEQLASTVAENARMAEDANQKVQVMSQSASQSGIVMNQANAAMERITSSSSKISNIIGLIDDIAFQTNLLALNASVEAARAGDAGKGFAVVAVEVRRLAQSAASASADVKALIEQSAVEVAGGSKLVSSAAEQLAAMQQAVEDNSALMQRIALASREQAAAIDEVSVAVRTMDEMTQHNAALVEETNAAIEQTEAQASELDRVVDIFTLADGASTARARPVAPVRQAVDKVRTAARSYLTQGNAAIAKDWSEF